MQETFTISREDFEYWYRKLNTLMYQNGKARPMPFNTMAIGVQADFGSWFGQIRVFMSYVVLECQSDDLFIALQWDGTWPNEAHVTFYELLPA